MNPRLPHRSRYTPLNRYTRHLPRIVTAAVALCLFLLPVAHAGTFWVFFDTDGHRAGDPVQERHIRTVGDCGARIRTISRYFNAVSVDWDGGPDDLANLAGVRHVEPVRHLGGTPVPVAVKAAAPSGLHTADEGHTLDYGASYGQLAALNVPALHDRGLTGEGVFIGIPDAGFDMENTPALAGVAIPHTRNFITMSDEVGGNTHGSQVLACLAGAEDGGFYGPAFDATYALAVTEDVDSETPADEDRFVAAVEWFDSLGVDIISASVLFTEFDNPADGYTVADMDGVTSLAARAASIAVSHGIVVVAAAGNEGGGSWNIIATPGDAAEVLAVGAMSYGSDGSPGSVAFFSSRGPTADGRIKPDIVAPGQDVIIPYIGAPGMYFSYNGTSYAAPLVAGVCALLLESHPDWTPEEVADALRLTARDMGDSGPDTAYGWGLADAVSADAHVSTAAPEHAARPIIRHLGDPYPNPFNAAVTIPVTIAEPAPVRAVVYDTTGRTVEYLCNTVLPAGTTGLRWRPGTVASGLYFVTVTAHKHRESRRVIYVK